VFQREITSKDNELDKVEGQLRRRKYIDLALDRLAQQLLQAAMGEGERQFQAALVPKSGEASVIMKGKDLEDIVWLADTGLQTWTANRDVPFRSGDRVSYARAEHWSQNLKSSAGLIARTADWFDCRTFTNNSV
jgi:hypothetical protein